MARFCGFMLEVVKIITNRCWLLIGLSIVSPLVFSQPSWELISTHQLAPGEQTILLLEQESVDLAVRLSSGNEILLEQDGPDRTLGTEVVFLENNTTSSRDFDVFIRPLTRGPSPAFVLESFQSPSRRDMDLASALSKSHQAWLGNDTADSTLSLLEPHMSTAPTSRLEFLVLKSFVDALVRSGQSELAIQTLQSHLNDIDLDTSTKLYLHWTYADTLYQALFIQEAMTRIKLVFEKSDLTLSNHTTAHTSDQWLHTQIAITSAAIQIGAGRQVGDRDLIRIGGDLLHSTLRDLNDSNDLALRARVLEYLSGFYNFYDGRDNSLTPQLLSEAEILYQRAGDPDHLVAIRNNQAYSALGKGEIDVALRLYLEALDLQKNSKHIEGKAHVRARLGYLYFILGDYRRAEMRYLESIQLYEGLGLDRKLVHNNLELAEVLRADNRVNESLSRLLDVQVHVSDNTALEEKLRLFTQLAQGFLDLGELDEAEESFQIAQSTLALNTPDGQARLQQATRLYHLLEHDIFRSRLAIKRGRLDEALSIIELSLMQLSSFNQEPLPQLELLSLMMRVLFKLDRKSEALEVGERALTLVNTVRTNIDFQAQAPQWVARTSHVTSGMVAMLLVQNQNSNDATLLQRAFEILQGSRARSLRESRQLYTDAEEPDTHVLLRESVNRMRQDLIGAVLRGDPTTSFERSLARGEEALELARSRTNISSPNVVLTIASLQKNLRDNEIAYIYASDELASHLISVSQQSTSVYALPAAKEVSVLVTNALAELKNPSSGLNESRLLAELLLPNNRSKNITHVLFETSGIFSRIPFAVLFDLADGVGSSLTTASVPSFSEYFNPQRSKISSRKSRLDIAVFADPAFSLDTSGGSNPITASTRNDLDRLPFTRVEANNILATFDSQEFTSYFDTDATIENFLKPQTRDARILHIAAHGFASTSDPLFLGLALANDGVDESGLLTTQKINTHRFNNELVVISACETADGQLLEGEGLMSMSRAFLANGASATLSTLWPVSDRANAAFMEAFYDGLHTQLMTAANALQFAQAQLKLNSRFRHPFYWGAFVLQIADASYSPIN